MVAAFQFAIRSTAFLLILSGLLPPLLAQSLKTPEFLEGVDKGFDHVYNLDYDSARTAFQNLQQRYPQHPVLLSIWP
jgi:TolA-binding protein